MRLKHMKKQSIVFLLLMAAFVLSGCNTVEGVGKDVQRGGAALEDAAKD
jgi:predicted small secreted protein